MNFFINLKLLYSKRDLLWDMTLKNLKSKYVGSILGIWWIFLSPLLIILALCFVFTYIFKVKIEFFPLFVLSNIFAWIFLANSLSESYCSLVNQSSLIRQFNLPKAIIPMSIVCGNFINFILGLFIIIPILIFVRIEFSFSLLYLPVVSIFYLFFIAGLCLLLSAGYVFFRDISHLLNSLLMVWFWLTPIFYSMEMVPEKLRIICYLNPLTFFMSSYRDILYRGEFLNFKTVALIFLLSSCFFIGGYYVFYKLEKLIIKRI